MRLSAISFLRQRRHQVRKVVDDHRRTLYGTFGAGITAGAVIVLAAPHKFGCF